MARVTVLILHPEPARGSGPLTTALGDARRALAEAHLTGFLAAGADDVELVDGPPDDTPFGARLRSLARAIGRRGLVVLGSGALPLATRADRAAFVACAGSGDRRALANNRYSADAVAVGRADVLADLPDLTSDNALPRWLSEAADVPVTDLGRRWHLGMDLDSPLDVVLAAGDRRAPPSLRAAAAALPATKVRERIDRVADRLGDPSSEVLVAGRTSAATIRWLERSTACRTRILAEERGLRTARPDQRPPASALGMLLDDAGPAALGSIVGRLADAAVVDSRVLLAHRLGTSEAAWPSPEDRYASDLLDTDAIVDPWLRDLTGATREATVPILLGGHTLVGPGMRRLLGPHRHGGHRLASRPPGA